MSKFDLKYRPRKFSQVLGNQGVVKLLLTRSKAGTLADQSMMFGGPKGCGKTTLARIVARAILCTDLKDGEPCGECVQCISIIDESSTEVEELDAASQGTVDRIRSMVRDTDYEGGKRIYLMDEAQRLTAQAQDALLKAVEDRLLIVILCTTEPHKIRVPIRSRVEEYPIQPPPAEDLLVCMQAICQKESIESDPEALKVMIRMLDECPRTCVRSLETLSALGPITIPSVNSHFRFGSYSAIDQVLHLLDSHPHKAFESLDSLAAIENPSWIRDNMVAAIASAMRYDVGAKPTYPVPTRFFQSRLRGWADLARILSGMEKPTMPDIEAALLASSDLPRATSSVSRPSAPLSVTAPSSKVPFEALPLTGKLCSICKEPQRQTPGGPSCPNDHGGVDGIDPPTQTLAAAAELPVVHSKSVTPASTPVLQSKVSAKETTEIPKAKVMEIDGVKFSADEQLTSLDKRMEMGSGPTKEAPLTQMGVEFGRDHVPISHQEFARGLIGRIKGSQ
jgi:DNA polymerase III subunit gamma/tau